MTCPSCPSDFAFEKFLADQLPHEIEEQLAAHLDVCEACRKRVEQFYDGEDLRLAKAKGMLVGDATFAEADELRGDLYKLAGNEVGAGFPASGPTADLFRLLTAEATDAVAGTQLTRFTVRRWLGSGAFGVVYLAYDELLHREVALKLPRAQPLARREVRERFLREAEAAAKLHHPNVVPVFEAGQEQGVCYIASAYCRGPALDAWLAAQAEAVPIAQAVTLVKQLAGAVQHAHEHRVLHRDIKPSNVLLETDLASTYSVIPMITDFGLAKLLDTQKTDGSMTGSQGMLGTPRYMAPEQASGNRALIGPETDIFALGAILYELLVGTAPYAGEDQASTLHRLFHDRAIPPRRLRSEVPHDLEAICLKCLEKNPADRYRTAQELVEDLRRFEQGCPTRARPVNRLELLRRWTVRQPAAAALLALTAVGLLSLLGIYVAYSRSLESFNEEMQTALEETRDAQRALEVQRTHLRNLLYVSKIALAHQAIEEKDLQQASRLLAEAHDEAPDVARGFVWRYLWNQVAAPGEEILKGAADIYELSFSPSGEWFAACGADGVLRIYRGDTLTPLISFPTGQGEINGAAFSPDEQLVATAGDDGTVRLWEVQTGKPHLMIQAHGQLAFDSVFTPDGATLISCGREPTIRMWDLATGEQRGVLEGHVGGVEAITLSPDGKQLASAGSDGSVRLWDVAARDPVRVLTGHTGRVVAVAYSGDGAYLLTGSIDHTIRLWRVADGVCLQIEHHVDAIASTSFYAGDAQLVAADRGGAVHLWPRNPRGSEADSTSTPLQSWKAHDGRVWEVSATPDESGLLTSGADGKVYRWTQLPEPHKSLEVPEGCAIFDVDFDPTTARLYYIDSESGVQSWDIDSGRQSILIEPSKANDRQPFELCMLPEQRLITAYSDGTLDAIDLPSETAALSLKFPQDATPDWLVTRLSASRFGRLALFSYARETTRVYDVSQARLIGSFEAYAQGMALSTDGTQLAMSDGDDVVIWNVDRGERIARLKGHNSSVVSLQFSPDGKWLASGSKDRHVRMWSLEEPREPIIFNGHRDEVTAVAFSPDGHLLASGDLRGELKFWFFTEAAELISIEGSEAIEQLLFSPSGDWLAVQSARQIHVYHASGSSMNP